MRSTIHMGLWTACLIFAPLTLSAQQAPSFAGTVRADDMAGLSYEARGCIVAVSETARRDGRAKAGEPLVALDAMRSDLALQSARARVLDLEAAVEERQLAIEAARADVDRRAQERDFAGKEFARNDAMFRRGLINEATMETVERRVMDARFAADRAAEALASAVSARKRAEIAQDIGTLDLRTAEISHDQLTVTAPYDGVLLGFDANVGDCVQEGALAAQIYDPSEKAVDIYVLIEQLATPDTEGVAVGGPVRISRVNGEICTGTVTRIETEVNLETQYVQATIDVDPQCAPGLFLNEAVEVTPLPVTEGS